MPAEIIPYWIEDGRLTGPSVVESADGRWRGQAVVACGVVTLFDCEKEIGGPSGTSSWATARARWVKRESVSIPLTRVLTIEWGNWEATDAR